jgi:hypothetical protein
MLPLGVQAFIMTVICPVLASETLPRLHDYRLSCHKSLTPLSISKKIRFLPPVGQITGARRQSVDTDAPQPRLR